MLTLPSLPFDASSYDSWTTRCGDSSPQTFRRIYFFEVVLDVVIANRAPAIRIARIALRDENKIAARTPLASDPALTIACGASRQIECK